MKILRIYSVQTALGHKSKTSIYLDVRDGMLTQPVQVGKRAVGWPDYEVESICKARVAGWTEDQIRGLVNQLQEKRRSITVLN